MYGLLNKLFDWLGTHGAVFCVGLGMGLYRCAHEWPVWFGEGLATRGVLPLGADNLFLLVDAGKVPGVIAYVAACYLWDRGRRSGALLLLPSILLTAGYMGPLLWSIGIEVGPSALLVFLAVCGAAAGMVFAQWIEVCGYMGPLRVIEALAVSYLVRTLVLPVVTSCDVTVSAVLITVLGATAFVQIALAYRIIAAPSPAGASAYPRTIRPTRGQPGHGLLFAWVCVFTFAFGLGEASTGLAHEVAVSGVGYAVPSLLVAVLAFALADRFDRNVLYAVSIPLMGAGLVSLEFFGTSAVLGQLLVSAGMCAFELLAYTIACTYGFRTRTSSMLTGSTVRVIALVSADGAVLVMRLLPGINTRALVALATLATVAMGFAMLLPHRSGHPARSEVGQRDTPAPESTREGRVELAAEHADLSPRERTVFDLLVQGKTAAQISEELFISNGAVRAHCSRIYAKFGVHDRKAFDEVLRRM